ncbi:uncharacterized protein TRAVEDRAFT_48103 [Trametes versicolor FP-101664 SS1]|uniref:uncharacterized protein n=1 Tax=Trametes versicolor (strain FP-101664) TaxID=717944 RepID=UPI00046233B7|nr:uncharacterized protein TRAVEDRAFT_48103 [Trametes versicolor FP-101664 SS1]EIW58969.1 hypothetical protein TRAVEDRAFT_48103 [Trametes versicolor FP-101664 SS1]
MLTAPSFLALDMSQSQSGKRRCETVSSGVDHSSLPNSRPSTHFRRRQPPKKKHRDANVSNVEPDMSGGEDATDGGIQAVASVARRACRTRILSAEEKRQRFKEKYKGMTPEQILATVSEGWRSSVYQHYRAPQIIPGPNGTSIYRFICKKYPSKHVDRADSEDSTGNLRKHADCCDPNETPESDLLSIYALRLNMDLPVDYPDSNLRVIHN